MATRRLFRSVFLSGGKQWKTIEIGKVRRRSPQGLGLQSLTIKRLTADPAVFPSPYDDGFLVLFMDEIHGI